MDVQGLTPMAVAVPPVAGWHDTGIPATLTATDVQALVDRCDRSCSMRAGDFAMVILVARLGLRSAEVARLELGDVDWRAGEVLIRGKARRQDRLPPPAMSMMASRVMPRQVCPSMLVPVSSGPLCDRLEGSVERSCNRRILM